MSLRDLNSKLSSLKARQPEPEEEPLPRFTEHVPPVKQQANGSGAFELLPQSADVEKAILSTFMQAPEAVGKLCVEHGITTHDFWIPSNTLIFETAMEMWNGGDPLDFITLTQVLKTRKKLDEAGGAAYVTELFTFVPTAANAEYYITLLKDVTFLRSVAIKCEKAGKLVKASNGSELGELIEELRGDIESMSKGAPKTRFPPRRDMHHLMNGQMPAEPAQVIHGVLHQGSKMVVGGTSKGRKTWALIDLAVAVASGLPWWGFNCSRGKVCYINFEIQEAFFARRTKKVCEEKPTLLVNDMFHVWTLRGYVGGIETMVDDLIRSLQWENYTLIIIDPIYKALGDRDENKAGDVASMLNMLEKVAVKTGAAIAFGAHYSKGNQAAKESIDRIGGSGVFARDPDSILTMTAHEQEECFTVDATLRNFAPVTPFVVRWKYPLFTRDAELDPEQLKPAKKNNAGQYTPKFDAQMILDKMSVLDGQKTGSILKLCMEEHGISRRTFYNHWDKLRTDKKIVARNCEWFVAQRPPAEVVK